jgi:acyl dehydratase
MAHIQPPGVPIERGKIHEFANAILDDHPLYHDVVAATDAGLPSVVAPPTFSAVAAFFAGGGAGPGSALEGLDLRFLLHGGQELIFERPLFAGDVLHAEAGEVRTYAKEGRRGGTMRFVETETVYRDAAGAVVVRVINTLIQTAGVVTE